MSGKAVAVLSPTSNLTIQYQINGSYDKNDVSMTQGIRPIIQLKTNIQTTGKDENGVWQLVAK